MALFVSWQGITKSRGDSTLWHQIFKFARTFKAQERYVRSAVRKIAAAGFFDAQWYLGQNPDVVQANINPLQHYVRYGAAEGRRPCPNFDPQWYLQQNPDVARAGVEPLSHYLSHGWREGRDPTPLFRTAWYLQKNPDVAAAGIEPLTHYMSSGWREGRDPSLFFQSAWYLAQNIDVNHAGVEPLTHYLSSGWREGRSPNRLFKPTWYIEQNPDVAQANIEPLSHYLTVGCREGRVSSPVLARALVARGFRPNDRVSRDDVEAVFDFMFKNPDVFESELWLTREGHDVTDLHYEILRCGNSYAGKDVCIFACYCPDGQLPASTKILLDWIKRSGVSILCVVATDKSGSVAGFDDDIAIIVRDNEGYDFAAWALALRVIPSLWAARSLLFANDSVYGPIDSDSNNLIATMLAAPVDCVALTLSKEVTLHFQSYFFVFKNQAMTSQSVRQFWSSVRVLRDQTKLIHEYEVNLFSSLFGAGLACQALFGAMSDKTTAANPTLHHWRALIKAGFPFIKKRVISDEIAGVDNSGWSDAIQNPELRFAVSDERTGKAAAEVRCIKYVSMFPSQIYSSGGFYDDEIPLSELSSAEKSNPTQVRLIAHLYDSRSYVRNGHTSINGKDERFVYAVTKQQEQLREGFCVAAGCIAVEIKNCYAAKSVLYTSIGPDTEVVYETFRNIDRPYTSLKKDSAVHEKIEDSGRQSVYVASVGSSNYGHWLTDDLPRLKILTGISGPITLYLPSFGPLMDKARCDAANMIAGLGRDLIVRFIDPDKTYSFAKLIYVTPVSFHPFVKSREAIEFVRSLASHKQRVPARLRKKLRIFVNRPESPYRNLLNQQDVNQLLSRYGIVAFNAWELSFEEQIALFSQAELIVGVMGAGMANSIFSAPGANVLYLAPAGWHEEYFWDLANALGHGYFALYGEVPDGMAHNNPEASNFVIDCKYLENVIEQALPRKWYRSLSPRKFLTA